MNVVVQNDPSPLFAAVVLIPILIYFLYLTLPWIRKPKAVGRITEARQHLGLYGWSTRVTVEYTDTSGTVRQGHTKINGRYREETLINIHYNPDIPEKIKPAIAPKAGLALCIFIVILLICFILT